MSDRSAILAAVPPSNRSVKLLDDQSVKEIMRAIIYYHKKHVRLYDRFAYRFNAGDERDIARELWQFCKDSVAYKIQDEELQSIRSPGRILSEGMGDCKHYASFIGGVLDALKRSGLDLHWAYRFAKYVSLTGKVNNHVFVVLYPHGGGEIWIDPVLNWFDYHLPYQSAITRMVETSAEGSAMGCIYCDTMGSAGTDLADALKAYEEGIYTAYSDFMKKGTITAGINDILKSAVASAVPGANVALQFASTLQTGISKVFGAGSVLTRVTGALLSSNVITAIPNVLKAIFGGRTYNTDSYFGASDYYYHVLGIDKGASTNVSDKEVPPALFWFETKLGIYVSGRAHLEALRKSVDDYLAFYKYNNKTTQDRVRVELARGVMMRYMPAVNVPGNWAKTVGVYDDPVIAAIERARLSDVNARTDTQGIVPTQTPTTPTTHTLSAGISLGPLLLLVGAGLFILSSNKR